MAGVNFTDYFWVSIVVGPLLEAMVLASLDRFLRISQNNSGDDVISVPNRQNTVQLIFGKNELGGFSESLRPPLYIAGSIMTLAGL